MKAVATDAFVAPPPIGRGIRASVESRLQLILDLVRYGLCSVVALALDWGTLIGLVQIGVRPLLAAAIGFLLGMALTYGLSIGWVYKDRRHDRPLKEAALFCAIGFAGLAVNQLMLWGLVAQWGIAVPLAKAPTAGVVFLFNFVLRRNAMITRRDT